MLTYWAFGLMLKMGENRPQLISMPDEMGASFYRKPEPDYHLLDGKTIRSTTGMKTYGQPLPHYLALRFELGIPLRQKTVPTKSNEIPAVQKLLLKNGYLKMA